MLEVKDITFAYGKGSKNVLDDVSFSLDNGRCMAILGTNGVGKSTLLKCLDRIHRPKSGKVIVNGRDVFDMTSKEMAMNIAYVAQNAGYLNMTVFDAVLLGRKPYIKWDATDDDKRIVREILHKMDLDDYILRRMTELSGGEVQKILLARALAQEPKVLLLDEPTSNLDPKNQHEVLKIVRNIAVEHNICVIMVLHDLNLAVRYCDDFLFLKKGEVYSLGGRSSVTAETIEEVYNMPADIFPYNGISVVVPYPEKI